MRAGNQEAPAQLGVRQRKACVASTALFGPLGKLHAAPLLAFASTLSTLGQTAEQGTLEKRHRKATQVSSLTARNVCWSKISEASCLGPPMRCHTAVSPYIQELGAATIGMLQSPPAAKGAASAEETPGTTSTGMPAAPKASSSLWSRAKTEGQPPLSRTTRLPCTKKVLARF